MKSNFWKLTVDQQRTIIDQAGAKVNLPAQAIEKDWWVTIVLDALFGSSCKDCITFKGGTSLSKGWHVIERFSEDIDIAIDKSFWSIAGDNKSQRDRIRKLSRSYIEQKLVPELKILLEQSGAGDFDLQCISADDSDADPTLVLVPYKSIYPGLGYMAPQVRIEFSCRSLKEPRELIEIRPLIAEAYPDAFGEDVFEVYAVVPTRTFLEKAFLLHEEFLKPNPRVDRLTRHLYDLEKLMDTEFATAALADPKMYADIVKHRCVYNTLRGVDYRMHHPASLDFIPRGALADAWRKDYAQMQEYFIYGESLPYDNLTARMEELLSRFRRCEVEDEFFDKR